MNRVRREKNSERKIWALIFVLVSVFCIVFFAARGRFNAPLAGGAVSFVLSPFQRVVSWVGDKFVNITSGVYDVVYVYEQNKMLREEVAQLREQNTQAIEFTAENERLRKILDYKRATTQFDLLAARVIGRESATWSESIIINRGTMDGVADNMTVVTPNGLVGHITEAGLNSAKVQLILDPRSAVGTLVQRPQSRVTGILTGDISNPTMPKMTNIPKTADVVDGDVIVTSGFGGIYPKGIVVGLVTELVNEPGGLLKYAVVETAVDFQRLEDVAVIIESREAPPAPLAPPVQTPGTETNPAGGKP